jgi:hypothetical protein
MGERSKTIGYIALDDPRDPFPGIVNFPQGGTTSPSRAKTVGVIAKLRLAVRT